jgi:hypothetical protein
VRFRGKWVTKGAAFLVLGLAFIAVLSLVVMGLWNALIPSLFHGPRLQFAEALGLLILSRILFGGFRGRGGWHGHWRERMWHGMTAEEREHLRARFKHRCGWDPAERAPEQAKQQTP